MGTVIGYKGTEQDRYANWHTMLMTKESFSSYRNSSEPMEQEVAEKDKGVYTDFLTRYVA
jgi:hypothetical protein